MEVPDIVAGVVVDDEKMLLILLRAEGLGTNETLPSRPNAPVPNEDINEVVRILKEVEENDGDDDDRFEGEGGTPIPLPPRSRLPSLLLLDFLDLLVLFRSILLASLSSLFLLLVGVVIERKERTKIKENPMINISFNCCSVFD